MPWCVQHSGPRGRFKFNQAKGIRCVRQLKRLRSDKVRQARNRVGKPTPLWPRVTGLGLAAGDKPSELEGVGNTGGSLLYSRRHDEVSDRVLLCCNFCTFACEQRMDMVVRARLCGPLDRELCCPWWIIE